MLSRTYCRLLYCGKSCSLDFMVWYSIYFLNKYFVLLPSITPACVSIEQCDITISTLLNDYEHSCNKMKKKKIPQWRNGSKL